VLSVIFLYLVFRLLSSALSVQPKKQVAGNCSSPATEDTGINQKNFKKANKQAQGVINKIFVFQGT
jgi:hypothetical protein